MKVRLGFVSNSSSSSFSIFGVQTTWDELTKVLFPDFKPEPDTQVPNCKHEFNRGNMKFCPECGVKSYRTVRGHKAPDYEEREEKLNELGWVLYSETDLGDGVYIGNNLKGRGGKRAAVNRLDELKEVNEKMMALFGREADFFTGEYAC
ncbi:MAG: hypothetical protein M0R80_02610 [Proteobacteria bacterium]|jgi:hypothetical protein|nr:hypothetical protein [Pseudomonadota bacterium]